jgi:serine O-acetyltransferase
MGLRYHIGKNAVENHETASCFENASVPVLKAIMAITREKLASVDPVWAQLRVEAETMAIDEPALAGFIHATILKHDRLENALSYLLARKLGGGDIDPLLARETFEEALTGDAGIGDAIRADLSAVFERDPACHSFVEAFLYYKGFHALECYRIGHWLWNNNRHALALFFQSRISELFAVDIHPAAKLGRGIMIDHATGVVIGETAVVEDDVSMLHGVTLGGTGKGSGNRHPTIRRGVLLSMGAKILGNIEIGEYSRVGAGSVVLKSVPAGCTAVGIPAKLVNCTGPERPSQEMNHFFDDDTG